MVGELEVSRNGRFVHKVQLASFGKKRLTIGAQGDILLASQDLPDVVAQLYAERGTGGETEVIFERLDAADGSVIESLLLVHGIEIKLPDGYTIKYVNPAEEYYMEGERYA